ncbi:MAG: PQQ-dependent sugar dehydrogenase [Chloroflexi bacterium]|nr:PQQ-dependent sugar dehydrogenase [Chloroflexota bacterium]
MAAICWAALCVLMWTAPPLLYSRRQPVCGPDGLPEIYAYGFQYPFRFSFDAGGEHGLYVADVGQDFMEEVDLVVSGGNYGWPVREGTTCFNVAGVTQPSSRLCPRRPGWRPIFRASAGIWSGDWSFHFRRVCLSRAAIPELNRRYLSPELDCQCWEREGRKVYYADTRQSTDALREFVPVP